MSWQRSTTVEIPAYHPSREAAFTYRLRSDFLFLKCDLPRLAVEVNSYPPGSDPLYHHRLMLRGACIVRFANKFLDAYKGKKNFSS